MKLLSAVLVVLITASVSFGFTAAPVSSKPLDFKYIYVDKIEVSGDSSIDANLTWHDISTGPNHTRWFAKPDEWTWLQYSIYFHVNDGNDANEGQADVNCYGADTYGGGKPLWHSTVQAGDGALSNDPNTGNFLRTNKQPDDPNSKWANADGNFVDTSDLAVVHSGTTGTTSTGGVLSYTEFTTQKFHRFKVNNITPAAKVDYVYIVVTGGK